MELIPYAEAYREAWDRFVTEESVNGTFLQTRRFLGYHAPGKYKDASFLVLNEKGTIVAACPATEVERDGLRTFSSHPGSTFGGLIVRASHYTTDKLFALFALMEEHLAAQFDQCILKPTPQLFAAADNSLMLYVLQQCGYSAHALLNTCVTGLADKTEDALFAATDYSKRRNVKKGRERGLTFAPLTSDEEIAQFHALLTLNLSKFGAAPIHTLDDLLLFRHSVLPEEALFYGVREGQDGPMVAACMLFYFANTKVLHTQNLSVNIDLDFNPAAFLYYNSLAEAKRLGCRALSWGTSAEENAMGVNLGLLQSKEAFGSTYDLNYTFTKRFGR